MGEIVMQRVREKKQRAEWSRGRKFIVAIIVGAIALLAVFLVLAITHVKLNYAEAREYTSGISATHETMKKFFDMKLESLELSDDEKKEIEEFESALVKCGDYMDSLGASNTLNDEVVREKYDAIKSEYGKIEKIASIWSDVKKLMDLTDDNLAELKKSKSEKMRELAEELSEYRQEIANYQAQYKNKKGEKDGLILAYGKMLSIGDDLNKKYEKMSLDDILGMSSDDISRFYATIEELNKILSEKV